jgi:ABC-type hemin transport system substrate-binding protein
VRIVSLVPSVTETLLSWGVDVIACTRFCEQPDIPHVGGTKDPDVAAITDLRPDLVVVDREENRAEDARALAAADVPVHITHVLAIDDVAGMLAALWDRLGRTGAYAGEPLTSVRAPSAMRRAFVPIWRRPWMSLNSHTYGASVLERLGVESIVAGHPDRYPTLEIDEVVALDPELVLLPSEPYPFSERHRAELAAELPRAAVQLVDGRDLFWWGTRTPAALRRLDQAIGSPTPT